MPTFIVEVKDKSGKISKEKVEANSPEQARTFLRGRYETIGKVRQSGFNLDLSQLEMQFSKVTVKDRAVFSRQFAVMVNAGVAIVRALGVLGEHCGNPRLKRAIRGISSDVQQGGNLSDGMAKYPDCFDKLYVSMVEAGEMGGVLDEVLNRLAKLLEDMARLNNQMKSAMTYPMAVGLFATTVFFGMTAFLIPIFAKIFEDLGAELPALTAFMVWLSKLIRSPRILIPIVIIIGTVYAVRTYYKTKPGRYQIDALILKIPLFGPLNEKTSVARFCRVFGTLTRSGVPILNCLDIVIETIGNRVISEAVNGVKQEIQQGGMLSVALERRKVFPAMAIQMMSIGEETGELDAMMMKVADFYEDEVEQTIKALTSLIEPVMMVGIAGMVGTILLSMYLPMFAIFDQIA